jgi:hypothetical protein
MACGRFPGKEKVWFLMQYLVVILQCWEIVRKDLKWESNAIEYGKTTFIKIPWKPDNNGCRATAGINQINRFWLSSWAASISAFLDKYWDCRLNRAISLIMSNILEPRLLWCHLATWLHCDSRHRVRTPRLTAQRRVHQVSQRVDGRVISPAKEVGQGRVCHRLLHLQLPLKWATYIKTPRAFVHEPDTAPSANKSWYFLVSGVRSLVGRRGKKVREDVTLRIGFMMGL